MSRLTFFAACLLLIATQQALSQTTGPTLKSYCQWRTLLGNANNRKCATRWSYKGITYTNECTNVDHFRYWCSVTEGAFVNQWGNCDPNADCPYFCGNFTTGGTARGAKCVIPFSYKGVTYNSCTNIEHNREWCATTSNYNNVWGNCEYSSSCAPNYCTDRTSGGTGNGAPCVFPFTYKGNTYNGCTTVDYTRPWCSTTPNFAGAWGNCLAKDCPPVCRGRTIRGSAGQAACVFPFTYKGVTYDRCTTFENNGEFWCSTTPTYVRSWGVCIFANNC